jgi:uncharacterized protein YbjT (DUF2867 family)
MAAGLGPPADTAGWQHEGSRVILALRDAAGGGDGMILVTGGTGTIGQATVRALQARGKPFKIGTRDPARAKASGTRAVELDYERPDTVARALQGINRVLSLTPVSDQQDLWVRTLLTAAKRAGVRHVVRLSVIGAAPDAPFAFARAHGESEQLIRDSGLAWTFLRPTFFAQNFLNYYGVRRDADATVHLPHGQGRAAWVDARDVGEVAAAALGARGHEGRAYDLTGPEALGDAEALAILSEALGRSYTYVDVPDDAARGAMLGSGMPAWQVDGMMELHGLIRNGHAAATANGVRDALGREARSFRDFARDLAAAAA